MKPILDLKETITNMEIKYGDRTFRVTAYGGEIAYNQRAEKVRTDLYYRIDVNHKDWWYSTTEVDKTFDTIGEVREYINNFLTANFS